MLFGLLGNGLLQVLDLSARLFIILLFLLLSLSQLLLERCLLFFMFDTSLTQLPMIIRKLVELVHELLVIFLELQVLVAIDVLGGVYNLLRLFLD